MRKRLTFAILALAACLALGATALGAVGIYSNYMDTTSRRAQMVKVSGRSCDRGGSPRALRVEVGKRTDECTYRAPIVGRDLEVAATLRLLSGTSQSIRRGAFLAVNLRNGGGGKYQLAVFPLQKKFQLRKDLPDGTRKFLAVGKNIRRIKGTNRATKVRLRAFNLTDTPDKDDCRLLVHIGDKRLAVLTDDSAGSLRGRFASVSVGSERNANGAVASFDDVVIRVPNPF